VTLRNNTVTGATHKVGVYVDASSINHVVTGNRIVNNGGSSMGSGLAFVTGGVGSKVETTSSPATRSASSTMSPAVTWAAVPRAARA